jgi:two-component system response regulator FixJ
MNDCLVNFLSDIRVLVVDDDPGMLNSLSRLISSFELNVSTFSKGQELVSSLPDDGRCLVISDVRMFDMPGMAILRWITEHRTEIPVILVSAYADVGMAVHAMRSGAVAVLRKPYSEDERGTQFVTAYRPMMQLS